MKTFLSTLALVTMTTCAAAPAMAETTTAVCRTLADSGAMVMELRQKGLAKDLLMKIVTENDPYTLAVIEEAYLVQQYDSETIQKVAILDFHNAILSTCLTTLNRG